MKILTLVIVCITALSAIPSIFGSNSVGASEVSGMTINGETVYWENSYAKLSVTPHTSHNITTQTQYCNLTWKSTNNQIDLAFHFYSEIYNPHIWIWRNYSHEKEITTYDTVQRSYTINNIVSYLVLTSPPASVDYGDIPSVTYADVYNGTAHIIVGFDTFQWNDPAHTSCTATYNINAQIISTINTSYWDWFNIASLFEKVQYNGLTYYVAKELNVIQGKSYTVKWQYSVHPQTSGKYELLAKLSSDSWSQARIILDPWWDANWGYRKLLTINATGKTLRNFPVKVWRAADAELAAKALDGGGDICFVDFFDNVTQLYHEIEFFNGTTNGALLAWLNVTTLYGNKPTRVWMYYGNPASANQQQPHKTWNSHYKLVVHFNESTGNSIDKTIDNYNGTVNGAPNYLAGGVTKQGYAIYYDATGAYFNYGDQLKLKPHTSGFTLEGWVCTPAGTQGLMGTKNWGAADAYGMYYYSGAIYMQIKDNAPAVVVSLAKRFCYCVGQHISGVAYMIVNATSQGTEACGDNATTTRPFIVGTDTSLGQDTTGRIDEVRYSNLNWNHSWLYTVYNTTWNTTGWEFFSIEEGVPVPPVGIPQITSFNPTNGSTGICPCNGSLCITVTQTNGSFMNLSFYSNTTSMTYVIRHASNGTYCFCACVINLINYNTTYYWRVNVTVWENNSYYNQSGYYHFTTAINPAACVVTGGTGGGTSGSGYIIDDPIGIIGIIGILGLLSLFITIKRRKERR